MLSYVWIDVTVTPNTVQNAIELLVKVFVKLLTLRISKMKL